jgi:hypothetical protein
MMNRYDKSRHETVLARARRIPMAVWNWWNELPGKQLTRRGIMELTDDQRSELGLPRRRASASQFRTSGRL